MLKNFYPMKIRQKQRVEKVKYIQLYDDFGFLFFILMDKFEIRR
jgi:hypothetical protein